MGKIREYIGKHRWMVSLVAILGVSASTLGFKLCKTNVEISSSGTTTFIVSNYDIGKGYRFVYNAEESGWEYLFEDRGEYDIFVETKDPNDGFKKTDVYFQFRNLGKNHPLSNKLMNPDYFIGESGFGKRVNDLYIGEELLNKVRKQYKDRIPFEKIKAKIHD